MFKIALFILLGLLALTILLILIVIIEASFKKGGINPYSSFLLTKKQKESLKTLKRIDDEGYLYYFDYQGDYSKGILPWLLKKLKLVKDAGCSCFMVKNDENEYLACRNYDMPHFDAHKEITGLNVIVHLHNEGAYESINLADMAWLSVIKLKYYNGSLDNKKTNLTPLVLIPALCMDGMNEKGLCISILALDLKEGETSVNQDDKNKESLNITMMLRKMLDFCSDVDEAVELAKKYNLVSTFNHDYHLLICDKKGKSIVMEWRFNKMIITKQDVVTNFYVSSDDGEDCYFKGKFIEKYPKLMNDNYHLGYGHGYRRFITLIETLDKYERLMNLEDASNLLESVRQDFTIETTSNTQYSAIYNLNKLTVDVCPLKKFNKHYLFDLKGEQIEQY